MCSASMNFAPSRLASSSNCSTTLGGTSHELSKGASLLAVRNLLTVSPPQCDLSQQQAPQMFLVYGLPSASRGLAPLRHRPASPHRPLALGVLEPICHGSQGRSSRQAIGRPAK